MYRQEFKAETKKLLYIVANSLYKDKDVFIRELLSNASDSLEKRRYESLKQSYAGQSLGDESPAEIQIYLDSEKRQMIIRDTGIGMSRDELVENLGTIARSGSQKFLEQVKETTGKVTTNGRWEPSQRRHAQGKPDWTIRSRVLLCVHCGQHGGSVFTQTGDG